MFARASLLLTLGLSTLPALGASSGSSVKLKIGVEHTNKTTGGHSTVRTESNIPLDTTTVIDGKNATIKDATVTGSMTGNTKTSVDVTPSLTQDGHIKLVVRILRDAKVVSVSNVVVQSGEPTTVKLRRSAKITRLRSPRLTHPFLGAFNTWEKAGVLVKAAT